MIVVADTSVILNLCCVQQQELLRLLFGDVFITSEVRQEFSRLTSSQLRFGGLSVPGWVKERGPQSIPTSLRNAPRLNTGEISAIALALELRAHAVLIDETVGRQVARGHGLTVIGVLGILIQARTAGLLPAISPVLDRLEREANFWLDPQTRNEALRLAGE